MTAYIRPTVVAFASRLNHIERLMNTLSLGSTIPVKTAIRLANRRSLTAVKFSEGLTPRTPL